MLFLCYKYISLGWILLLLTHLSLFLWMTTFKKTATFSFLGGLGNLTGDTENKDEFWIVYECKIAGRLPMCWQQEPFKLRWQNISDSLSWSFRLVLPQAGNNWLFSVWCPTNKWYSYFFFIYISRYVVLNTKRAFCYLSSTTNKRAEQEEQSETKN